MTWVGLLGPIKEVEFQGGKQCSLRENDVYYCLMLLFLILYRRKPSGNKTDDNVGVDYVFLSVLCCFHVTSVMFNVYLQTRRVYELRVSEHPKYVSVSRRRRTTTVHSTGKSLSPHPLCLTVYTNHRGVREETDHYLLIGGRVHSSLDAGVVETLGTTGTREEGPK